MSGTYSSCSRWEKATTMGPQTTNLISSEKIKVKTTDGHNVSDPSGDWIKVPGRYLYSFGNILLEHIMVMVTLIILIPKQAS